MSALRVAVIGLGNMGRHHVRHYHANPNVQLVAVCDIQAERVAQFTAQYHCKGYTDLSTLLTTESLDAISLIAPTSLHFQLAKPILEAGIHLLIEKPISETVEQAQELIALASQKNCILAIGHIERFNPAIAALKTYLDNGHLGDIASITTRRMSPMPAQIQDANVVIDLAVHDLDIICWLMNSLPIHISSFKKAYTLPNRADYAAAFLTFDRGVGYSEVGWISPIKERSLTLTGTKGIAYLNYMTQAVTIHLASQPEATQLPVVSAEPLGLEIAHFVTCIQRKSQPLVSGLEGLHALACALQI